MFFCNVGYHTSLAFGHSQNRHWAAVFMEAKKKRKKKKGRKIKLEYLVLLLLYSLTAEHIIQLASQSGT